MTTTEFVVQDGFRRIRFDGDLLARASSKRPGVWRWTDLALYRTLGGTYILEKTGASRVTHVRDCPLVVEDLPRFQEAYPGEDPDDDQFTYDECVPDVYDFPSLLVEKDRHWAQISEDPTSVIKSLMRYRAHSRWLPRTSTQLLERAAEIDSTIRHAYESTDTPDRLMLAPYTITAVHDSEQFCKFLDWLRTRGGQYVAVDTETSDANLLYSPEFRVRLIQIGDTQTAWVLPWATWGQAAAQALTEYRDRILMHNSAYDMAVLQRQGYHLDWAQVTDTFLAMRIAEPNERSGLKESSDRHLDPDADLSQKDLHDAMRRNGWTWDDIPIDLPIFVQYSGLDVILTSRLYEAPVVQDALRSPIWQLEMDTAAICARMAQRGMRIDISACERHYDRLVGEAAMIRDRVQHDHGLNVGSTKDCGHWLFGDPEAHPLMTKSTAGGAISVDKEVLEKISVSIPGTRAGDLAAAMLQVRSKEKIAASYFKVFIDRADSHSVVHPQILTSEARSSRMSIRQPALQTLPKDDSAGVRGVVLARTDDEDLITSDYDQIEMRIAAVLSQDEGLLQAFRDADASGGDFFTSMGAQIYHDPGFIKKDPRRRVVKNAMYGTLYGAGPTKVAVTAGISLAEATETLSGIFTAYPGLRRLMRGAESQAKRDGHVTTMGGRRLDIEPAAAYKALNYIIQGSAAVLLKRALVDMACAGLEDFLVVPVHDEVVFSVPRDSTEDVRRLVADIMPITDLPLEIGAEPSLPMARWGAAA